MPRKFAEYLKWSKTPQEGYHFCPQCAKKIKNKYPLCYPCQWGQDNQLKETLKGIATTASFFGAQPQPSEEDKT